MNALWFIVLWLIAHVLYTLSAVYYLAVLFPSYISGKKQYITNSTPKKKSIRKLMKKKKLDKIPMFKFQITTKGFETHVVKRGIECIIRLSKDDLYKDRLRIDVVTDEDFDRILTEKYFKDCPIPLNVHVVPVDYRTRRRTLQKARALHYMIELRKKERDVERGYIVHFDAESVITPKDFRRIVYNTIKKRKKITEGPIVYPIKWFESNPISRQMEANRPFHCYHCHKVMTDPPPQHLHGSNLVIDENLAIEFGWDIGNLDGQPFIAEDLLFGLKAYLRYGGDIFGWHGGALHEQPAMTVGDSIRQRIRWVTGVWQTLRALKRIKTSRKSGSFERFKIRATLM